MAKNNGCIIVGSTSSVTTALSQIYFLLSRDKTIYLSNLPTFRQKEKSVCLLGTQFRSLKYIFFLIS